jgi:hypothetical protein
MPLKTIRLELARTPDHPDGNPNHGYEFHAPLDGDSKLDVSEWDKNKELCSVRRFEDDLEDEHGVLIHTPDHGWTFSYVPDRDDDDEPVFRLGQHVLKPGEYLSITEHDDVQRTFVVASVKDYLLPSV